MDIHQELKELSKFLSEYSTSLMAVGVQTSRIVRNTARIAESFGFLCDMTIFQKTIIMTLPSIQNLVPSAGRLMMNDSHCRNYNAVIWTLSASHARVNGWY